MTPRCILCETRVLPFHWHNGTVVLDVLLGAEEEATVVLNLGPADDHVMTASEALELADKLREAAGTCDRANGVVW